MASLATVIGAWLRTGVNVAADDPIGAIDDLGSRPVLLIAAGRDRTIPVADAQMMRDAALAAGVDVRLEVCAAAGHADISSACPDDYRRWVDAFMSEVAPTSP